MEIRIIRLQHHFIKLNTPITVRITKAPFNIGRNSKHVSSLKEHSEQLIGHNDKKLMVQKVLHGLNHSADSTHVQ